MYNKWWSLPLRCKMNGSITFTSIPILQASSLITCNIFHAKHYDISLVLCWQNSMVCAQQRLKCPNSWPATRADEGGLESYQYLMLNLKQYLLNGLSQIKSAAFVWWKYVNQLWVYQTRIMTSICRSHLVNISLDIESKQEVDFYFLCVRLVKIGNVNHTGSLSSP